MIKTFTLKGTICVLVMAVLSACQQVDSSDQSAEVEALYSNYLKAWLRNDEQTEVEVLALFADDATIIPSGGNMIFTGKEEMKGFWFPVDAPPSTVDLFEQEILKVTVNGDQGGLLGRFKLKFSYETGSYYTEGYNILTAVMEGDQWKITTMMWNHPPWELIVEE